MLPNLVTNLELKTHGELLDDVVRLHKALRDIDNIAVGKKAGAAVKMQAIARKALELPG